jgi:tetratricopeptide (TPR) repeat protein
MLAPEHGVDMSVLRSRVLPWNFVEHSFCVTTSPQQAESASGSQSQQKTNEKATPKPPKLESGASIARRIIAQPDVIKAWDQVLSQESLTNDQIADAVAWLHDKKHYEAAVEGLQSVIRNDRSAPWVYDVLALEMKLAGRPGKDIARVLESRIDFSTSDVQQMLITAALLSRFEAWSEAIAICREATELNPEIPQVWLLGRSVADKSKELDAQVFFRCGILTYDWGTDFESHHEEARKVVNELCLALEKQNQQEQATGFRKQLADANTRDLLINLVWVGDADLDLAVVEPGGQKCNRKTKLTLNRGRLVREDSPGESATAKHMETYVCQTAPSGEYELRVQFVLGKAVSGTAVLEIIQHAGTPAEKRTAKTVALGKKEAVVKVTLSGGRKTQ